MHLYKNIASCILILSLFSACAPVRDAINPYNEDFHCKAPGDVGKCIDTPTAYKEARYNDISDNSLFVANQGAENSLKQDEQNQRYKMLTGLLKQPKKPLLQPPKILRVLLLPYQGENEELFMTRYVYVKIEDSKWVLTDLTER